MFSRFIVIRDMIYRFLSVPRYKLKSFMYF